jgi:hypothetical protein
MNTAVWTALSSPVVSNCEIAGLIGAHWKNHPNPDLLNPNGDANFFGDQGQLLAIRRDNRLQVLAPLLSALIPVRSK